LTCPFWLTSTEDLPALQTFYRKAIRLRQRAQEAGNPVVLQNQDNIIPLLTLRIRSLEDTSTDSALSLDELVQQLRADLVEVEVGRDEACEAGLFLSEKHLERSMLELQANLAELEELL
jgi:hypothetical protein